VLSNVKHYKNLKRFHAYVTLRTIIASYVACIHILFVILFVIIANLAANW